MLRGVFYFNWINDKLMKLKRYLLTETTSKFQFKKLKSDKKSWYYKPGMMGEIWAKEKVDMIETVCAKYAKTKLQKFIIKNSFDFERTDWNYFQVHLSKKYVGLVRNMCRQVDKYKKNMASLLYQLNRKEGVLKTSLTWALEWLAYKYDKENYHKQYAADYGFYGMKPDDARKRLDDYIKKIEKKIEK